MELLVLDGKSYVKASTAAKRAGYTADYVGQLARAKKVDAHLIGRTWYVDESELTSHRTEKKRNSRVKAREQVRRAVEEAEKDTARHITVEETGDKAFESRIQYEEDVTPLMPEVRKLEVTEEKRTKKSKGKSTKKTARKRARQALEAPEPSYTIENEGEKIVMEGTLVVEDATDSDTLRDDVTFLEAKVTKGPKPKKTSELKKIAQTKVISVDSTDEGEEEVEISKPTNSSFLNRLREQGAEMSGGVAKEERIPFVMSEQEGGAESVTSQQAEKQHQEQKESSWHLKLALILGALVVASLLFLETRWSAEPILDDPETTYTVTKPIW